MIEIMKCYQFSPKSELSKQVLFTEKDPGDNL